MKRTLPFVIIAVVLGAVVVMFLYFQRSTAGTPSATPSATVLPSSQKAASPSNQSEPGAEPAHALGNANAPVTLEEFGDFECPPCGLLHPILKNLEGEYGQAKLRIIFREFPLVPAHVHALAAARAA
jgi:protein-disulfide isomerase